MLKPWQVHARSPKDEKADLNIQDADLLIEFYNSKTEAQIKDPRFAELLKERRRYAMHLTKLHSHFYLKRCTDNLCEYCTAAVAARTQRDPLWQPCKVLQHLKHNNYHMYLLGKCSSPQMQSGSSTDDVPSVLRLVAQAD